jgi:4-amino-4-deoxy-L-arabinose transferase-like glycosyltransferase
MLCRLFGKFERDDQRSYRASLTASGIPFESSISFSTQLCALISSPALIFVTAFGIRLLAMVYMQSFQIQDNWKFGFETGRIAASIASGQGFSSPLQGLSGPTAWLPPIYPYMLAGIFKLFGVYSANSALVALTLNSLFSALNCVTIFYIGRKTFGPKVAIWAAWSWAFFPYAVFWSTNWVWATSLSALLFSLVCLASLYLEHSNTATAWLGFGLLWGLVGLTDTALLSTLPFFAGWLWYRLSQQGMTLSRATSACTLGFILILTPWLVRNYFTFGEFVFIKSNFGMELHLGNYEGSTGLSAGRLLNPAGNEREFEKFRRLGELSYIQESKREALDFIVAQPGTFFWLTLRRLVYFWTGNPQLLQIFHLSGRFVAARYVLFTLVSVLAFLGLFLAFRSHNPAVPLFAITLLVFPIVYYITHPTPRYRHPIEPAMIVLGAYALTNTFSKPLIRKLSASQEADAAT